MFAIGSLDSFLPAYGVVGLTMVLLLGAVAVVASRVLTARSVQCPATGENAQIVVESQKRVPWNNQRKSEVAQCSLQPGGVTCAQGCLNCGHKAPQ